LERLTARGFDCCLVGGCVRDMALGRVPRDYDIATQATPDEMKAVFIDLPVIDTGVRYGTVTVISGGLPFEITTFRSDGAYTDGRRPDSVTFTADIAGDLARRDFTVNAMAFRPPDVFTDPFNGGADCRAGLIRCVGDPEARFKEDALRILRALRFSAQLEFSIEAQTQTAMRKMAFMLPNIAAERITQELSKLMACHDPSAVLRGNQAVFASLAEQWAVLSDVEWQSRCDAVHRAGDGVVRLALLCAPSLPRCLRLDNQTKTRIHSMLCLRQEPLPRDMVAMKFWLSRHGLDRARDALAFRTAFGGDTRGAARLLDDVMASSPCLTIDQLAVNGSDMTAAGVPPGPAVGRELRRLLDLVIGEKITNEREALLAAVIIGD